MSKEDREALQQRIEAGLENEKQAKKKQRKQKIKKESKEFQSGFKKFVTRGDVVELAVALAISTSFNKIVNGIVEYVLTPIISIMTSGISMSDWKYILADKTETTSEIAIRYGSLIEVTLDFFLIALMLYMILRVLNRIKNRINQSEIERAKLEEAKKKEEAKIAAEAQAKLDAEREAEKRAFYEDIRAERELLTEIRDSLKSK